MEINELKQNIVRTDILSLMCTYKELVVGVGKLITDDEVRKQEEYIDQICISVDELYNGMDVLRNLLGAILSSRMENIIDSKI